MSLEAGPTGPIYMGLPVTQGVNDVLAERARQVQGERRSADHDDRHTRGELTAAALCYGTRAAIWLRMRGQGVEEGRIERQANDALMPSTWPWSASWWKPHGLRRCLVIAAALIIAEIERLDRAEAKKASRS